MTEAENKLLVAVAKVIERESLKLGPIREAVEATLSEGVPNESWVSGSDVLFRLILEVEEEGRKLLFRDPSPR